MRASDAIDALVMALDSPLLAGLDVGPRLYLTECEESDRWMGLSSGEQATLTIGAGLEDVRLLLHRVDGTLAAMVADALTALADEAFR